MADGQVVGVVQQPRCGPRTVDQRVPPMIGHLSLFRDIAPEVCHGTAKGSPAIGDGHIALAMVMFTEISTSL